MVGVEIMKFRRFFKVVAWLLNTIHWHLKYVTKVSISKWHVIFQHYFILPGRQSPRPLPYNNPNEQALSDSNSEFQETERDGDRESKEMELQKQEYLWLFFLQKQRYPGTSNNWEFFEETSKL